MTKEYFTQLLTDTENQPHQYVGRPDDLSADMEPKTFEEAVKPLMKWLADNYHPHMKVLVDSTTAERLEDQETHIEFARD